MPTVYYFRKACWNQGKSRIIRSCKQIILLQHKERKETCLPQPVFSATLYPNVTDKRTNISQLREESVLTFRKTLPRQFTGRTKPVTSNALMPLNHKLFVSKTQRHMSLPSRQSITGGRKISDPTVAMSLS